MTPAYLNPQPSPFPIDQSHEVSSSSSSSLSCPIFSNLTQDQGGCYHGELQLLGHPREADMLVSLGGSYEPPTMEDKSKIEMKFPTWTTGEIIRNEIQSENNGSCKWMPLKMRIVRKMMTGDRTDPEITPSFGDHKQLSCPFETEKSGNNNSSNINTNTTIRVCADCYTTKTPLWRSGPRGPKSLCNACGIRQRKARRAMAAAAAAAASGTILATNVTSNVKTTKVQQRDKKPGKGFNSTTKYKKRCKLTSAASSPSSGGPKRLRFEDFTISLSKKYAAFHRVFPQDEKEEAAILLMALSCGLVCS